ncbi:hypothetical protein GEV33_003707 [Tenebrio molitor]|uniref:Uncharacterized protein n=1 Tax=Tenebrio molitor TaxID=7067 RepID=A0A8J6LE12_TENMO|nr:hypothetical protein GEV33_003707 [Tenebrio molitor]
MLIQNSGCNYGLQCTENVACKIRCQNKEQNFEGVDYAVLTTVDDVASAGTERSAASLSAASDSLLGLNHRVLAGSSSSSDGAGAGTRGRYQRRGVACPESPTRNWNLEEIPCWARLGWWLVAFSSVLFDLVLFSGVVWAVAH